MSVITWNGIQITITHTRPTRREPRHHLEIRANEPLPINVNGYRSFYVERENAALWPTPEEFVMDWLDSAAVLPRWIEFKASQTKEGE